MADGKPSVTVADIRHVVDQIVERFHPAKIWLFGSFAYGTPTPDSDVDLLIAMDTPLRNVQQAVEIRKAVTFPFPVDLLVRTPQQIAERLAVGDVFFQEVLTKGIVLHETAGARVESKSRG
jgi:predicted nucleotidyltransferase